VGGAVDKDNKEEAAAKLAQARLSPPPSPFF
jgi:hypothetical protein